MQLPFAPLGAGGYRDIHRLALTVTAFWDAYQRWPETLMASQKYLIELFEKIPKAWHQPVLNRLQFEISPEEDALSVADADGRIMDYQTAASQKEAQAGCDWLFTPPVKVTF